MRLSVGVFALCFVVSVSARAENPAHVEFYDILHDEYAKLADDRDKRSWFDGVDAQIFRDRAAKAKRHVAVKPFAPADRVIGGDKRPLLQAGFARLTNLFDRGGRQHAGVETAIAQVSYDCWLEAVEGRRNQDAAACRDKFEGAITEAETRTQVTLNALREEALDDTVAVEKIEDLNAPNMTETVEAAPAPPPALTYFQIPFDANSAALNATATDMVNAVIKTATENPSFKIAVRAHADASGSADANAVMAQKRADAVLDKLAAAGIGADRLHMVEAVGATRLGQRIVEIDLRP